jgi:hypothetical protein
LVPIVIVGAWVAVIRNVQLARMNDLGLVSVLPDSVIVLLFLLTISFCLSLTRRPPEPLVALLHVVVLIVILYGVTTFIEGQPRVSAVYKHVGVIDYIGRHGSVNTSIDAYFDWPGFFALGALITKAAGFHSALAFAAWGPLVFNLLFLPPLFVIFRWASDDPRVRWLGLWVFYSTNWVAQDHISPQATGFLLWLSILAALLTTFTPRPAALAAGAWRERLGRFPGLRRLRPADLRSGDPPVANDERTRSALTIIADIRTSLATLRAHLQIGNRPGSTFRRTGLLLLIVAMYVAIVSGHQLTPVPATLAVAALVIFARTETRLLPVTMTVLFVAWVVFVATSFVAGHFSTIAGPLGHVSENLGQSVGGRYAGSSQHQVIVNLRVLASAVIWLLAIAGFARRLRSRRADVAIAVTGVTPFLLPAAQPYGGEILLRAFLFALPAVSFYIATLAFPSATSGRTWPTILGTAVVGCVLLGVFQYTRYGNERLDNFTTGDAAVVHDFYRVAPKGSAVFVPIDNLPWRYRNYDEYRYGALDELRAWGSADAARLAAELRSMLTPHGGYLLVTRSTEVAAELLYGKLRLIERVVKELRASPGVREIYRNPDGELFRVPPRRVAGRRTGV